MAQTQRQTIRFEDLGEPVQKLLKNLKGGYNDEDMVLLEYVGVKDMAKIYQEMSSDRRAEAIWEELKAALIARREKQQRKAEAMESRAGELDAEAKAAEEEAKRLEEEEAAKAAEAEAKRLRREERRRKRAEQASQMEEDARAEEERLLAEEAARLAEEEEAAKKRREDRRRKRAEKAARLAEEQEALAAEQEKAKADRKRRKNQKKEWSDYVASHPLEFSNDVHIEIKQVKVERETKPPPTATEALLARSYTPQCPNCHAKYSKPPTEWDCPMCLRKFRQKIKTWQPDVDSCGVCTTGVGRFTRHHCRNCGRVVCGKCSDFKAAIPAVGFKDGPVKVCRECMEQLAPAAAAAAAAAPAK